MSADRLVRWTAVAAVLAVAAVAALISYRHAVDVVSVHGETGALAYLYPVVIDGLIVAASMVLLDAARHREEPPALAWWMLAAGVVATLVVNVLAGLAAGVLGAVIASWPALAFVGCYELVMLLVRASAKRAAGTAADEDGTAPDEVPLSEPDPVPSNAGAAAEASMKATLAAGNPWSVNALATKFGLPRKTATEIRERVFGEAENEAQRRVRAWNEQHQDAEPEPVPVTALRPWRVSRNRVPVNARGPPARMLARPRTIPQNGITDK